MEESSLNESNFKKKVAVLDKIPNPEDLFHKSRKLLTQFVNVFKQETGGELVEECLIALQKLKEGFENIAENKLQLGDVFDAIDVLFDIGRHAPNPSCSDNAFRCIIGIIAGMEQDDLRKIHKTFLKKLTTLRDFYEQSISGRVMMVFIELLMSYIGSFAIECMEKIANDVRLALANNGDQTLLDLTEWNKTRTVELTRCFANHIPGAKFYLLAVNNGTIDETNLQPAAGSGSFITEWNIHTQCLTIESRVNGCDEIQVVRVLFADVVKYSFSSKNDSPHIQLKLTQNVVKLYTDYIADIQELQLFLKPTMGGKETKMLTPLDIGVNHIKIDEFDDEESIVDHLPESPLQTTAAPERLLNLEQSSIAASWGRLNTTGSIACELEDGASPPSSSAINEVVGTDEQSLHSTFKAFTRRRGSAAVHKIANNTASQSCKKDKNGCNQLEQDPYDLKNIANDGGSSEGKTQGRKKRVAQKPKPKSPLPSLVKRICYNRASGGNKTSCDSTNIAKDDEDDIDIAEDSDDSWQPDRKKPAKLNGPRQPTKRTKRFSPAQKPARPSGLVYVSSTTTTTTTKQGRRVSVTNVEKSTFVPQQPPENATQEEPDNSLVEILQQIRENPIFDAQDSSTASLRKKRKSPPGRCLSYGSTEDVVPSESVQPGLDLVPTSFSGLSFEQASVDNGQPGTKLQYVLDNIVAPGVEELARTFGEKIHEANNYYDHLVASCDSLFKAMAEKHTLYLQQEQAAARTLDEFLQLAQQYKKTRPTETELKKRITEAAENERLFKMQLSNERNKFKSVIDEAAAHDWDNMTKTYANIIHGTLFGND